MEKTFSSKFVQHYIKLLHYIECLPSVKLGTVIIAKQLGGRNMLFQITRNYTFLPGSTQHNSDSIITTHTKKK